MRTTIDAAGRIVIPKKIREQAGIATDSPVEVRFCDGKIELEPVLQEARLERVGHLLIAVTGSDDDPITQAEVDRALEEARDEAYGRAVRSLDRDD